MEVIIALLVALASFLLGLSGGMGFQKKKMQKDILNKENIIECFKDVDWNKHTFMVGSEFVRTDDGVTQFYKAIPIQEAIQKLNELLDNN